MLLGSTALDVAIGLVFIYLVVSLICSALNEGVEARLNHRSKDLERGICEMLTGTSTSSAALALNPQTAVLPALAAAAGAGAAPALPAAPAGGANAAVTLAQPPAPLPAPGAAPAGGTNAANTPPKTEIVQAIYDHPLISSLFKGDYQTAKSRGELPSYIPARNFSQALLDTIRAATADKNAPVARLVADPAAAVAQLRAAAVAFHPYSPRVSDTLVVLIDEAGDDVDRARQNIEQWFDNSMDRVSGWYKRRAQYFIVTFGLVIAAAANVDTIAIVKALSTDGGVRDALVAQAGGVDAKLAATQQSAAPRAGTNPATATAQPPSQQTPPIQLSRADLDDTVTKLRGLGLPVGWDNQNYVPSWKTGPEQFYYAWAMKVLGILLTGLAVSLGAPFWFDLLNRFITVRASVKPAPKTPAP